VVDPESFLCQQLRVDYMRRRQGDKECSLREVVEAAEQDREVDREGEEEDATDLSDL
jgi:hypothetical protein